jgi:hypothetical protein
VDTEDCTFAPPRTQGVTGKVKRGSSQISLQATLRVRRAARPAVVPSQASATVSIAESSADTFPAVDAPHPAAATTCRASFPEACLAVEPEGNAGASAGPGTSPSPFVRSGSPRDRAAGIGDGWLPRRSGDHWCLPQETKNADGPLPHPTPLPTLRLACTGSRAGARIGCLPGQHMICRPCNEIDEDPPKKLRPWSEPIVLKIAYQVVRAACSSTLRRRSRATASLPKIPMAPAALPSLARSRLLTPARASSASAPCRRPALGGVLRSRGNGTRKLR